MLDNAGKAKLLGIPFGTANARLRKALLFQFAGLLGKLNCYRCSKPIESIDDFSIEHKKAWAQADDSIQAFYDLDNIAFSHLSCNVSTSLKSNKKYSSIKERKAVQWGRYYDRHGKQLLQRRKLKRRQRYAEGKSS